MPDQMPPPGPGRDEAIAIALGGVMVDLPDPIDDGTIRRMRLPGGALATELPPYSTDPAAADRLVEEMVRRGWWVTVESQPNGKIFASVHRGYDYDVMIDAQTANGTTRPDAVSAAALLALRGGA